MIYVLTTKFSDAGGKGSEWRPVAILDQEHIANQWADASPNNDWIGLEMNDLSLVGGEFKPLPAPEVLPVEETNRNLQDNNQTLLDTNARLLSIIEQLAVRYKDKAILGVIKGLKAEGKMAGAGYPPSLNGLAAEAKKAPTFEDFKRDFLIEIKHGRYYHLTDNPDFTIDPEKGPRDMSSMGGGGMTQGALMITSHLDNWHSYYNYDLDGKKKVTRPYVAIIDMSEVPRKMYYQVKRGFGNEFYVTDSSKARLVRVVSISNAIADDRRYDKIIDNLFKGYEDLEKFYNAVNGNTNEIEPGKMADAHSDNANKYPDEHAFLKSHNTGYIDPRAYDKHTFDWLKLSKYKVLLKTITLKDGSEIELRQSGEILRYVKTDAEGDIVRDERGTALYLSPEEMKEKGLAETDTTVAAFDQEGNCAGYASDEWGSDGVWVRLNMQKKGLGVELLTEFRKQFKPERQMGQMTPAGQNLTRSYYRSLTGKEPMPMGDYENNPDYKARRKIWQFYGNLEWADWEKKYTPEQAAKLKEFEHQFEDRQSDVHEIIQELQAWVKTYPAGTFSVNAENALMGKTGSLFTSELLNRI